MSSNPSSYSYPVPEGTKITLTLPDDFHHHFRDGPATADVLGHATQQFGRAIAMPNLQPPVRRDPRAPEDPAPSLASSPNPLTLRFARR